MKDNEFSKIISNLNQEQISSLIDYAIKLKQGEDN